MKAIRFVLVLFVRETMALILIGAIVLFAWAGWQFLTGSFP
jgi:hypothetical protein